MKGTRIWWNRMTDKVWCWQHMMRVRFYRKTGIALRYRWAKKISGITIIEG